MTETFDIGDMQSLKIAFTDEAGNAADPTGVTFKMREPDGVETTYIYGADAELVKESVGNYQVGWTFNKSGRHIFRFAGAGAVAAAEQNEVYIRKGI